MNHSFNTELAALYGVDEAILIENFAFWIRKNEANGKFFYEGRYWTYNTVGAFAKLFPYWSAGQVRRILQSLIKKDVLVTGNFNQSAYDRTMWYAFTDSFISILNNLNLHLLISQNGNLETNKPIPDINTDINTDINNSVGVSEESETPATLFPDEEKKKEPMTLFANSKLYAQCVKDGELDIEQLRKVYPQKELEGVDIGAYFWSVSDWSDTKNKKRTNRGWIATIRDWIRKDVQTGKVKRINNSAYLDQIRDAAIEAFLSKRP